MLLNPPRQVVVVGMWLGARLVGVRVRVRVIVRVRARGLGV